MNKIKIKAAVCVGIALWTAAFFQFAITMYLTDEDGVIQAFNRNHLRIEDENTLGTGEEDFSQGIIVTGSVDGQLTEEQWHQLVNTIFHETGTIQTGETKPYNIVYGYSVAKKNWKSRQTILVGETKSNVSINQKYNEDSNQTQITFASPVNQEF